MAALHGILVVDKPPGLTSAQVVSIVKRQLRVGRAGHTGTLDPMATGVLPICLGEARKLAGWLIAEDKAYEAELELGVTTDTLDVTGAVTAEDRAAAARIDEAAIEAALARFRGPQLQVPPMYSAIKLAGRRLHDLARDGEVVDRAPRAIEVRQLELLGFAPPRVRLAIACSKGTYVRSLVHDLGVALGCGAHLTGLRRTRSGDFLIERAVALDGLTREAVRPHLVAPVAALGLSGVTVPSELVSFVDTAQSARLYPLCAGMPEGERFQLVDPAGALLAVVRRGAGRLHFDRVFRGGLTAGA